MILFFKDKMWGNERIANIISTVCRYLQADSSGGPGIFNIDGGRK